MCLEYLEPLHDQRHKLRRNQLNKYDAIDRHHGASTIFRPRAYKDYYTSCLYTTGRVLFMIVSYVSFINVSSTAVYQRLSVNVADYGLVLHILFHYSKIFFNNVNVMISFSLFISFVALMLNICH